MTLDSSSHRVKGGGIAERFVYLGPIVFIGAWAGISGYCLARLAGLADVRSSTTAAESRYQSVPATFGPSSPALRLPDGAEITAARPPLSVVARRP